MIVEFERMVSKCFRIIEAILGVLFLDLLRAVVSQRTAEFLEL